MKNYIRRFVDWMEHGPSVLTIWFIPLLLLIAFVAMIVNKLNERKDIITK